jgi:hypothetical protein
VTYLAEILLFPMQNRNGMILLKYVVANLVPESAGPQKFLVAMGSGHGGMRIVKVRMRNLGVQAAVSTDEAVQRQSVGHHEIDEKRIPWVRLLTGNVYEICNRMPNLQQRHRLYSLHTAVNLVSLREVSGIACAS